MFRRADRDGEWSIDRRERQADARHRGVPVALLGLSISHVDAACALAACVKIQEAVENVAVARALGDEEPIRRADISDARSLRPADLAQNLARRVVGLVAYGECADAGAAVRRGKDDALAALLAGFERKNVRREIECHAELAVAVAAPA